MQADTRRHAHFEELARIAIPDGLSNGVLPACFLDGIVPSVSSNYVSAALVGQVWGAGLGIAGLENSGGSKKFTIIQAPPLSENPSTWPSGLSVDAACGVSGGRVAFATRDSNVTVLLVHNSPAAAKPGWDLDCTIVFEAYVGIVQQMLERDGVIYGFTKDPIGDRNAFFAVAAKDSANPAVYYYEGMPAEVFFYKGMVDGDGTDPMMQRRIGFHYEKVYAIEQTGDHALCASLRSGAVTRVPLSPQGQPSWSLAIDETLNRAYCAYTPGDDGTYVMPYVVGDSDMRPGGDPIYPDSSTCCPAVDENLGLLYLLGPERSSPPRPSPVLAIDVATNTPLAVDGTPPRGNEFAALPSTWADRVNNLYYVSGLRSTPGSGSALAIGVYRVSVA
ncbi:hypothetical protein [Bordetella genomosp. 11]|uniref:Uncharacterized protein n=1 Tax=Bordetella genomosp. 11 TaxID=1416808 RepID=A0A261UI76_9BORD|nr:hypothetical protein [Bordetella genomosp. 11]OZI61626.1 hypothetical protein CAL28_20315 [Bordetella genomosp. 11]